MPGGSGATLVHSRADIVDRPPVSDRRTYIACREGRVRARERREQGPGAKATRRSHTLRAVGVGFSCKGHPGASAPAGTTFRAVPHRRDEGRNGHSGPPNCRPRVASQCSSMLAIRWDPVERHPPRAQPWAPLPIDPIPIARPTRHPVSVRASLARQDRNGGALKAPHFVLPRRRPRGGGRRGVCTPSRAIRRGRNPRGSDYARPA